MPSVFLERIVSGGQTGVDRAALDVALLLGIACGGWCPRGRKAEDGIIAQRYPLRETPSGDYRQRTRANVFTADGTLILYPGRLTGGTALTARIAQRASRPCYLVDLNAAPSPSATRAWLHDQRIRVLNVAGPRESQARGIYRRTRRWLLDLLARTPRVR